MVRPHRCRAVRGLRWLYGQGLREQQRGEMLFPGYFPITEKVPFHLKSRFRGGGSESVLVEAQRDPAGRTNSTRGFVDFCFTLSERFRVLRRQEPSL